MRCSIALAFVCLPLVAQENPPADVDAALRARIDKFYQAHVDGKFRVAEQVVAEDSKDYYYEGEKERFPKFKQTEPIVYSDNFTKAKVNTTVTVERKVARMGLVVMNQPVISYWKIDKGQWCWYRFKEKYVDTPFGRALVPDENDVELRDKVAKFKKVSPGDVLAQVKVSGSAVALTDFQPASGTIIVSNGLPGQVTVEVSHPPVAGLKITVDKKVLKSGESAKVLFECNPPDSNPKGTIIANIVVQPLNQTFPITITFASRRPARDGDSNH